MNPSHTPLAEAEKVAMELVGGDIVFLQLSSMDILKLQEEIKQALLSFSLKQMEPIVEVLQTYNGLIKGIWRVPEEGSNKTHDIELTIHESQHKRVREALAHYEHLKRGTEL